MKLHPLFEETDYPTDALIGRVSAGEPIEIGSEFEQIDLNHLLTRGDPYCMLIRIRGISMFGIGDDVKIKDGDWLMLNRRLEPQPTNIVFARINEGFTVKRFKLNDRAGRNGLYLVPANQLYETRKIDEDDDFEIIGVVTHIIQQTV